ncbi:MAG: tRNA (N6-isopentenyl adenosine(37)-C2)-methylthiotransferase MiaB [Deltaproteobacteria bacterium]|nr:tRNA (N6-isopentenyl adenosine(37)-C2)-methylthiotransferase MiaB [Deltaproteobacteria bacterium]
MVSDKSIYIKTFGCQMNVYDSDRMRAGLEKNGFRPEPDVRRADVILLNTCSIREKAEHKVLSLLGQLRTLKDRDPHKVIGVAGCVGQRMGRALLQTIPALDFVVGPDAIDRLPGILEEVYSKGSRVVDTQLDGGGRVYSQPVPSAAWARPAEFLTVMKGCDHFCSYCIVPFVRGREKSRPIAEIIADVKRLVAAGAKEITFLGQNINTYGKGTAETLSQLIDEADRVTELERIRYVTSHPRDLNEELMSQFGNTPKLCPALHLPFQAGSDRILKRMARFYTQAEYLAKVERLRHYCPDIALSTDVIVGFPGETEEDFKQTLHLLESVRFSGAFLFKYSSRPGTRASHFTDEVAEPVKEERLERAQEIAYGWIKKENEGKKGRKEKCLIESLDKKGSYYMGRSLSNKVVHVLNAGAACLGKIIEVEITDATVASLKGYYVGAPKVSRQMDPKISASVPPA